MESSHASWFMSGLPIAVPVRTACRASVVPPFVMAKTISDGKTGTIESVQPILQDLASGRRRARAHTAVKHGRVSKTTRQNPREFSSRRSVRAKEATSRELPHNWRKTPPTW